MLSYIQHGIVEIITYNKEKWYSLELSYKIKSTCILYDYLHTQAIGKLSIIPKKEFVLPNMNYCGVYNLLNKQLIYDKNRYTQKKTATPNKYSTIIYDY